MEATTGADWYTPAGNRRYYMLSLNENDLLRLGYSQEELDAMTFKELLKTLNDTADMYVVGYACKEGGISEELATKRLEEISNG